MSNKEKVHELFDMMTQEMATFIQESESGFSEGWNTWRDNRDDFSRKYIFSLIDFLKFKFKNEKCYE